MNLLWECYSLPYVAHREYCEKECIHLRSANIYISFYSRWLIMWFDHVIYSRTQLNDVFLPQDYWDFVWRKLAICWWWNYTVLLRECWRKCENYRGEINTVWDILWWDHCYFSTVSVNFMTFHSSSGIWMADTWPGWTVCLANVCFSLRVLKDSADRQVTIEQMGNGYRIVTWCSLFNHYVGSWWVTNLREVTDYNVEWHWDVQWFGTNYGKK